MVILILEVLTTTRARCRKSFFRSFYMQTIAEQAEVHFAYFPQRDQLHKQSQKTKIKVLFQDDIFVARAVAATLTS